MLSLSVQENGADEGRTIRVEFLNIEAEGRAYRTEVYKLYEAAFPAEEKKPFEMMEKLAEEGKMELMAIVEEIWIGLAFFMISEKAVILDYFAVSPELRSGGYGGKAVRMIMERFQDKKLIFEIEMQDEKAANAQERARGKAFYLRNGMRETGVFANVYQTDFELLTADGELDYEDYEQMLRFMLGEKGMKILKPRRLEKAEAQEGCINI